MDDEIKAVSIQRGDLAATALQIRDFIASNPNIFGGADIFNLDFGSPVARSGLLAAVLTGLIDEERRLAVRRFVVVVPPGTDRATAVDAVWTQFADSYQVLAGCELQPREAEALQARLNVLVVPDRRQRSVLDIIAQQEDRAAVIIVEAASYRDDAVEPYIAPGALTPLQPEDLWAPQLHALASGATTVARERKLYVALDADQLSPHRQALAELLLAVEGCGVMGSNSDEDPQTILAAHVDQWDAWIREGRLGQAVVLKPCDWKNTKAARFKQLPRDGRAVTDWRSADHAYLDVTEGIRKVVKDIRMELQTDAAGPPARTRASKAAPPSARKATLKAGPEPKLKASAKNQDARPKPARGPAGSTVPRSATPKMKRLRRPR